MTATAEIEQIREQIDNAKMPEDVDKHARKELGRLAQMSDSSPEYSMVRTYLDWLVEIPWALPAEDPISIDDARRILDDDHFGLAKIKRRILEYLAVRKLNPEGKTPILCFVGPPGVGKTSLGQSIAKALGRKFQRLSLGGVHDESEIRGHRRTYIGAMPGNVIQAIRKAGTRNCVLMLDEIDKLGQSMHGDPSAALLEVLDPEQNGTFRDKVPAGRAVRPVARRVHRDRQRPRPHSRPAAGSHGGDQPPGLHRAGEARDRAALSRREAVEGHRTHRGAGRRSATRCACGSRDFHARGACASEREIEEFLPPCCDAEGATGEDRHRHGGGRGDPKARSASTTR